jgi:hypothetical protein
MLHSSTHQCCGSGMFIPDPGSRILISNQPIEEGEEYELINTMIDELNAKCGLDLSHEVSLYRPAITSEPDRPDFTDEVTERVVMVGGSHSSRLTDNLDDTCLEVMDISVRGWRLSETAVEEKARELSEIVSTTDESRTTIVYQLFDNSSYYVKRPDGSRSLPAEEGMADTTWTASWRLLPGRRQRGW